MGSIKKERPAVFFFCAMTYGDKSYFDRVLKKLCLTWGDVMEMTEEYSFSDITPYYQKDMGSGLFKRIVFFNKPVLLENLHLYKVFSNQTEDEFKENQVRNINLDPGYITEAKVVLFSTKDFSHRIYLGEGIFAEITLSYKSKKGYEALPWTFADYKDPSRIDFFNRMRELYRDYLKKSTVKNT